MTGTLAPFEADILEDLLRAQRGLDDAPAGNSPPRHPARRRIAASVVVAASLGATAVVVATSSSTSPSARPGTVGPHIEEPIHVLTVASITRRANAALGNVDDMVLQTHETRIRLTESGTVTDVYDTWSDRGDPEHSRTMYFRDGQPVYDLQADSAAPSEMFVDYLKRTWYENPTIDYSHGHLLGSTPDQIREQLSTGQLSFVGHETIDGRDTLHLSRHDIAPLTGDLWVDTATYLVVRSRNAIGTTDYTWLARNADSRSKLVPEVPAGFTFAGRIPETPANPDGSVG